MRRSEEERRQREREERSRRRPADGWRYEDDRPPRSRGAYDDDGWEDVRSEIRGNFADDFSPGYREGESWEDRPHVPEDDWVEADRPGHAAAPRRRRRKRRRVLLVVLLVLAVLAAAGVAAHALLIRAPELPAEPDGPQSEGTDPGSLGAGRREGVYTFLLVGRDDGGGGNTDTIMVGCFDTKNGTLDVLSIFRDTLVDVPWEIKKINSVYNRQGIEGLQAQVKNLIGYQPDYYFVLELSAVTELVDTIGGVDYEVPYDMDYDDPTQDLHIHFKKGMQHLDGADAVKLLRWRKNNSGTKLSVGDIGRVEIQHSFLQAMAAQTLRIGNLTKIKSIADIVTTNLTSDLGYGEMIWFGEQALGMARENIRFHSLPGDYNGSLWSQTYQNYQSYVFVNGTALRDLVNTYLDPYTQPITADQQHILHDTTVDTQTSLPGG